MYARISPLHRIRRAISSAASVTYRFATCALISSAATRAILPFCFLIGKADAAAHPAEAIPSFDRILLFPLFERLVCIPYNN
jgi:hypothetical protein